MVGTRNELKVTLTGLVVYLNDACFEAFLDSFVEYKCYVVEVKCPSQVAISKCAEMLTFCLQIQL